MKKLLLITIVMVLFGCSNIEYRLNCEKIIPKESLMDANYYTIDLISASNQYHDAGNSRNTGDVLYIADRQAINRFGVDSMLLQVKLSSGNSWSDVSNKYITKDELEIYNHLLTRPLGITFSLIE